jgi:putative selenium metabolism hydrolase
MSTDKALSTLTADLALQLEERAAMTEFLRRLVQTPSLSTKEDVVADLVKAELAHVGVGDVGRDSMGNVIARLGSPGGPTLVYNAHLDTVGATNAGWVEDPFAARVDGDVLYGLGACDAKGSLAAMTYAAGRLAQLDALQGQLVLAFVVQQETCEGLGMRAVVEEGGVKPDWVVLGDPTDMQISRGQRGRVRLRVTTQGKASHAARPDLGQNAIVGAARLIFGIDMLTAEMLDDPFLGPGSVAVTHIESQEASLSAIPDECTFYADRRLTLGETATMALAEIERIIATERVQAEVEVTEYHARSYTGKVCSGREAFNAWGLEAEHPLVASLSEVVRRALGYEARLTHWHFSTDGVYTMGEAGIPTVGFGPGNPDHAHSVEDQVRLDDVANAAHVYAALGAHLLGG